MRENTYLDINDLTLSREVSVSEVGSERYVSVKYTAKSKSPRNYFHCNLIATANTFC